MTEQDRQISEIVAGERSRLRNFIRRRVPDPSDMEDIVQEVFYELVEANRLCFCRMNSSISSWISATAAQRGAVVPVVNLTPASCINHIPPR
jgi:DNA-directed RNA polymerase specialized sigma24 family protein